MLHLSFGITAYILTLTFFLGAAFGSFADCAAMRMVAGESVISGRSHCDHCGHVLGILDLIPLFSWLFLKGKCRYCGEKVPTECFFTELLSGIVWVLIVYRFDLTLLAFRTVLLWTVLLTMALADLYAWIIPDRLQVFGILIFLITAIFLPDPVHRLLKGILFGILLGGGMLLISLAFDQITGKESLGGGDIKLFFMTGLYLNSGWEILFYLILSCIFGLIPAIIKKEQRFPFGPSIGAACMVLLLYGEKLTGWYTGLF